MLKWLKRAVPEDNDNPGGPEEPEPPEVPLVSNVVSYLRLLTAGIELL